MDRREQDNGDTEPEDPARGREHRHVHVVEHEDLIAQHREAVEVFGPLMMSDRDNRCLQPRHVRLERDGDLVPEAALDARRHRAEKPRGRGRGSQTDRRGAHEAAVALEHAFAQ